MFKKPFVAAIICVIVVVLSTVVSVRVRLNPQCEAVNESFYRSGGIADQLTAVCDAGAGIVNLAESNGMDTKGAESYCLALRLAVGNNDKSSLMNMYRITSARLNELKVALQRAELSEKDAELLEGYSTQLDLTQTLISADPYNSSVKSFLQGLGGFSRGMAKLCGVDLPEQFA